MDFELELLLLKKEILELKCRYRLIVLINMKHFEQSKRAVFYTPKKGVW